MSVDAINLAVFASAVHAVAEEMGAALRRASYSPNIKERRDYSCAVFNGNGDVIAMGDHMPVHLGSMPMSVQATIQALQLERDDIAVLNDPYAGGTHLPDITMVLPVFPADSPVPKFYVAARAHHADVGGRYPGSMGSCSEIFQEGLRVPPVKLVRRGELVRDVLQVILANVRTPDEREGDLTAQIGACRVGEIRLEEITARFGGNHVDVLGTALLDYSERLVRAEIARMPAGVFTAEDYLDDDGVTEEPIRIRASVDLRPEETRALIDFAGSDNQVASSVNAVYAITVSAVYYVFRCLVGESAPATAGILRPLEIRAPEGTVVNARLPAPVAGGNVETSQRIVDVVMRALAAAIPDRIPAASSGTMNNLTVGGIDPRTGRLFSYYETIAGGMGARPGADGIPGVHTHMTNSLNTPAEALEYAYPLRVRRYCYRAGSGGRGRYCGGDGLVRELELLADAQVTMLADRRRFSPYGLAGASPGARGKTTLLRADGTQMDLSGKFSVAARHGDVLRIETPGGGGWGEAEP